MQSANPSPEHETAPRDEPIEGTKKHSEQTRPWRNEFHSCLDHNEERTVRLAEAIYGDYPDKEAKIRQAMVDQGYTKAAISIVYKAAHHYAHDLHQILTDSHPNLVLRAQYNQARWEITSLEGGRNARMEVFAAELEALHEHPSQPVPQNARSNWWQAVVTKWTAKREKSDRKRSRSGARFVSPWQEKVAVYR